MAGLGNPGSKYHRTRHNVGFDLIELLSEQLVLSLKKPLFRQYEYAGDFSGTNSLHLIKPLTYMNRSGDIMPGLLRRKKISSDTLLVITDNMDLPPGKVRMKANGSSAGHNGLKSIIHNIDSGDFFRLYIGVGRPDRETSVVDHVLGEFSEQDRAKVDESLARCASLLAGLREKPISQVLNEINTGNS